MIQLEDDDRGDFVGLAKAVCDELNGHVQCMKKAARRKRSPREFYIRRTVRKSPSICTEATLRDPELKIYICLINSSHESSYPDASLDDHDQRHGHYQYDVPFSLHRNYMMRYTD